MKPTTLVFCIVLTGLVAAAERRESGLVTYVYRRNSPTELPQQFIYQSGGAHRKCWYGCAMDVKPGDRVALVGHDDNEWSKGDFFNASSVSLCGHEDPPSAVRVRGQDLADDRCLHRLVIVGGTVTDVFADDVDERVVVFQLVDGETCFYVNAYLDSARIADLRNDYLGADVSLQGLCEPHNGERYFCNRFVSLSPEERPRILRRRVDDPRQCPPLRAARSISPALLCDCRYHSVSGTVLAVFGGGHRFLLREGGLYHYALEGQVDGPAPAVGERVLVAGVPSTDLFSVRLRNCRVERLGAGVLPEDKPLCVSAADLRKYSDKGVRSFMRFNGHLVRAEGTVLALPRPDIGEHRMMLDLDGHRLAVDLSCADIASADLHDGAVVSVTGRFLVDSDDWTPSRPFPHIRGIVLVPRTAADIAVVRVASHRYVRYLLAALGLLAAVIVALLFRGRALKMRTRVKTEERTRLAVELHDSLSQNLSGIALQLGATRTALESGREAALRRLDTAERMIDSCRRELKRCLYDLRHHAIDESDLNSAVKTVIAPVLGDAILSIRICIPRSALDDTAAQAVLSILRELAVNGIRHGHARHVSIAGSVEQGRTLLFSVRDDGTGFDPDAVPGVSEGHFGLNGVLERLERLRGELSVKSAVGSGTYVRFTLPSARKGQVR